MHNLTFQPSEGSFIVEVSSLAASPIAESLTSNATGPVVSFNSSLAQIGGRATVTIREHFLLGVPCSLCSIAADLNQPPSNLLVSS